MAYNRDVILERMKIRTDKATVEAVAIYTDLLISCEDFVTMQTNFLPLDFPDPIGSIILQMALELYNQVKSEGYQNETVEGITIRYQDILVKYEAPLKRYRKLRTI